MDDSWLEDFDNLSLNTYEDEEDFDNIYDDDDEEETFRSLLTYPQLDCFLEDFSNHTTYQTVPIASSINEYLRIVKSNILSEYSGFLNQSSQTKIEAKFSFDKYGYVIVTHARQSRDLPKPEDISLPELHHHAMIYQGHLCISRYHGAKKVIILKESGRWEGRRIPTNVFNDFYGYEEIIDLGYIGDLLNEYSACNAIYISTPSIMHSIIDPRNRRRVEYGKHIPLSDSVPINDRQLLILNNLQYDIEAIQGPPGTGKSTTIYHIVNSFLPEGSVTLATCVQNKAVDAIAEKFAKVNNIKFFVYGNEQRLGMLAKEWTLDSQVMRDSRVISIIRAQQNFNSLRKLFYEKNILEKWVELRKMKREKAADHKFGDDIDIEVDTPEYKEKRLWILNDVWGRCISAYCQSRTPLLRAIRKYLNQRVNELCLELKLTEHVVRTELITSSNVILCTIATASRSLLTEIDLNLKVCQINTAILDEAGNCPEHKLPLLALLPSLQRIIMIGDQKQLQPFTYISNKDNNIRGGRSDGICRNFLKGYCSYGNSCHY
jgi:DNA polymerase III delta prime subunit